MRGRLPLACLLAAPAAACQAPDAAVDYAQPLAGAEGEGEGGAPEDVPDIEIVSPAEGEVVTGRFLTVRGTAADEDGIDRVVVWVGDGEPEVAEGRTAWLATVAVTPGDNVITATVTDVGGREATAAVTVRVARRVRLAPPPGGASGGDLALTLDRALLEELISEEEARSVLLLRLDPRPLMREALARLVAAEPGDPATHGWGEMHWRVVELLRMTPDTAQLEGTSLAGLVGLAETLGLAPPRLLADLLGVGVEEPVLPLEVLAEAVAADLVGSHPAVEPHPETGEPCLPVTLHDALADFATLQERFGPVDGHPGVVAGPVRASILADDFGLRVSGRVAVRRVVGLDLGAGRVPLLLRTDPGGGVLDLALDDPAALAVEGLSEDPRLDLTIRLAEADGLATAGATQEAGPDGDFFRGDGEAWALDPWTLEHLVVDAAYRGLRGRYSEHGYRQRIEYSVGSMQGVASIDWDRGWVTVATLMDMGDPPPPQYVWDLVGEVAQACLHDGGVAEGDVAVELTLTDLPLGMSGDDVLASVRTALAEQGPDLVEAVVGSWDGYHSPCDLYVDRGEDDGVVRLVFVSPDDIPGRAYGYPQPGLYADAERTDKVSTPWGEPVREALALPQDGEWTLFAADDAGVLWELEVTLVDGVVDVVVVPREGE